MPKPSDSAIAAPGVYMLLVRLGTATAVRTGAGRTRLAPGWYAYTGRALRGVAARLARHLRTPQVRHWHLDELLAAGRVMDVQVRLTSDPADECRTAAEVRSWPGAMAVPGFGNSDCRCPSHLARFERRPDSALGAARLEPGFAAAYGKLLNAYDAHASQPRDPFETLVTCILSLRTQDPVTDAAADRLLAELRTPQQFAVADSARIAKLIFPVGMYRQKAQRLVEIARQLLDRFDGTTPAEIDALTTLPGVGRKTANLVRSFAYHLPAVCVDTHVHRISNRWGLVRTVTPEETELALRRLLPEQYWMELNPLLVQHGQQLCRPTRPRCAACFLAGWCGYPELLAERQVLDGVPGAPSHPSLSVVAPADGCHRAAPAAMQEPS